MFGGRVITTEGINNKGTSYEMKENQKVRPVVNSFKENSSQNQQKAKEEIFFHLEGHPADDFLRK